MNIIPYICKFSREICIILLTLCELLLNNKYLIVKWFYRCFLSKLAIYKNFTKHFFVLSSMKLCLSTTQFNVDNVDNLVYKSKTLINTANLNVDKFVDNSFFCG